jgi:type II secretory pathway pseudopilin PulG
MKRPHRDELGVTLVELLVVLGILGFILAAAWLGMSALSHGGTAITTQDQASHTFADPLEEMSMVIMQNTTIQNTDPALNAYDSSLPTNGDYCLEAWTDRNNDGNPELNAFYADSAGELVWDTWVYSSPDRTSTPSFHRWVMSATNSNVATGIKLFHYYDATGSEVATVSLRPANTVSVAVDAVVPGLNGASLTDSRQITFRDR